MVLEITDLLRYRPMLETFGGKALEVDYLNGSYYIMCMWNMRIYVCIVISGREGTTLKWLLYNRTNMLGNMCRYSLFEFEDKNIFCFLNVFFLTYHYFLLLLFL